MNIYFTFDPRPDLKEDLVKNFPDQEFVFQNRIDDGLKNADIVVTYGEDLTEKHVDEAEHLQWIMVCSAGLEKMPLKEIAEKGIVVSNVRGIHKTPMAESVLAHLLSYHRSLPWIYGKQKQREWSRKHKSTEIQGTTALILGPGAIGGEIGRLLQAFGVKTIGCNRSGHTAAYMDDMVDFANLESVLPQVDTVISVLPSTEETHYLLKDNHFKAMKDTALFMNFGRGDLVETDVLKRALEQKEIAYAVCDVFEDEPLPEDHPFWTMDNITVSPHISSQSSRYLERSMEIFKPNLEKWLKGEQDVTNKIDPLKGY